VEELIEAKTAAGGVESKRRAKARLAGHEQDSRHDTVAELQGVGGGSDSQAFDQKIVMDTLEKEFGIRHFRPGMPVCRRLCCRRVSIDDATSSETRARAHHPPLLQA
jgi:hypothetical protein